MVEPQWDSRVTTRGVAIRHWNSAENGGTYLALERAVLPAGVIFQTLDENLMLCENIALSGWSLRHFRQGYRPEAMVVDAVLRQAPLPNVAKICPQAVMMFYLFQVEIDTQLAGSPKLDLHRTQQLLLSFQIIKRWLVDIVYPEESWSAIVGTWPFEEVENRIYQGFQRAHLAIYGEVVEAEAIPTGQIEPSFSRSLTPQDIHHACPGMHWMTISSTLEDNVSKLVVEGPIPVNLILIGNTLANYWQARGVAWLAGAKFVATHGYATGDTFVNYLPRKVREPSTGANYETLQEACSRCPTWDHWRWPHQCMGPWSHVLHHARSNVRAALRESGAEEKARSLLRPQDVVIHIRCFPFFNDAYPLAGFSLYDALPEPWRNAHDLRFLIVAGPLGPECDAAVQALVAYLKKRYKQSSVLTRFTSTNKSGMLTEELIGDAGGESVVEEDFALLVFAPVLFRIPSSFSLWAALARNDDDMVISAPNFIINSCWNWAESDFGPAWNWVRAPLLVSTVAEQHGFVFDKAEPWIQWLWTH